ncbi:jg2189 [Pararge aegeria aegeria]|uniref:Jg2189 protein n=1 Tax=Pararge aegeria aegeria TaxID=348720 RepID=A0A8S4QSV5_9NEOP|nr:jg2189 [Pararge aegeria aegeria]
MLVKFACILKSDLGYLLSRKIKWVTFPIDLKKKLCFLFTATQRNAGLEWGSEWGSARKSLNPGARRIEGIVGLRAPHVRLKLGSKDGVKEFGTVISPDDVRSRGPRLRRRKRCTEVD